MNPLAELIGESTGIAAVRAQVAQLLQRHSDARKLPPLLILGETGTGKGLLARAIHRAGPRAAGPFVDVNCAAIPDTLLEAELFGFERGAFTDARQAKAGLFQTAHRGTLFLDEVGLLPEALQAKLLKALEDRAVRRLGSTKSEPVDVWVLTATSEDLEAAIRTRRFREDLYHRLAVVTLWLPPLRERGQDVLRLAEHFLARACADYQLAPKTLTPEARAALLACRWSGNIRELSNVMERVALLSEAALVTPELLALPKARPVEPPGSAHEEGATPSEDVDEEAERARLLEALHETDWNVSRAAARLGISRNALRYRMEKHGLRPAGLPGGSERAAAPDARPEQSGFVQQAVGALEPGAAVPSAGAAPARGTASGIRWERRHVALLRADLVVPRTTGVPSDTSRAVEVLVEKVQSFGGRIEELGLTRVTAAFGLEPLEDAPWRAAHAAMAIEKAAERARRGAAELPGVRIGLHVGQVMVGRVGGAPQIEHDAKREAWALLDALVARAEPGAVLVSEAATPFLERRFSLAPVRGPGASEGFCRLGGLERTGLGLGWRLARFVGRQREITCLERCCEEARGGALRVVDVVGEAGIGKSRLVHELRRRLEGQPFVFLQGSCSNFGGSTPFLPFIEVVRSTFLIGEGEGPEEVTGKLRRGLELLGLPADASLPFLQVLLGLEVEGAALRGLNGEIVGARTREALCRVLRARCQLAPLVLILDDLHWTDTASEELVLRLVESEEPVPLILICAYRAPYRPPWAERPGVTELRLEPLSEESCLHLVRQRLGAETLPRPLARQIVEKAEGNPLFAEEITRYLLESGSLGRSDAAVPIPGTLQNLLMARVERLDEGARTVLQVASVVGRRFPVELVRTVSGVDGAMARCLRELEAQELIFRQEAEGREEYLFTHVLVQDAVYESLLAPQREALHQRVAEAIEWLYATRLGEWVEVLAHHYRHTPRVEKTVRYLALAGQRSLQMYSLEEAHRRCQQVVELIEAVPGCADEAFFADAILNWIQVYYYRKDFRGLIALVERYRPRFEALGDTRRLSLLLFWLGFSHFFGMRCDTAGPLLERALALGEALGDETCIGHALMGLTFTHWVKRGDEPRDVVDRLGERALAVAEKLGDVYLQTQCLHGLGLYQFTSGRYKEARALGRQLVDLGRRTGAVRPVATGLHLLALVDVYEERYQEAIRHAEESLRASPDTADRLIARTVKGAALALMGRSHRGLALLRDVRREIVANDYLVLLTGVDYPYGAALVLAGEMAAGVRWVRDSIRRFTAWGNESIPAVGHMILGEIHLRMVVGGERPPFRVLLRNLGFLLLTVPFAAGRARRHLERAIRIARDVDVPAVLARSLLDMGLLSKAEGDGSAARAYLEEALRVAEPLELPVLGEKIRAALEAPRREEQQPRPKAA